MKYYYPPDPLTAHDEPSSTTVVDTTVDGELFARYEPGQLASHKTKEVIRIINII